MPGCLASEGVNPSDCGKQCGRRQSDRAMHRIVFGVPRQDLAQPIISPHRPESPDTPGRFNQHNPWRLPSAGAPVRHHDPNQICRHAVARSQQLGDCSEITACENFPYWYRERRCGPTTMLPSYGRQGMSSCYRLTARACLLRAAGLVVAPRQRAPGRFAVVANPARDARRRQVVGYSCRGMVGGRMVLASTQPTGTCRDRKNFDYNANVSCSRLLVPHQLAATTIGSRLFQHQPTQATDSHANSSRSQEI